MTSYALSIERTRNNFAIISIVIAILLVLSSIGYLIVQFFLNKQISDVLFVSLTLFESLFVLFAGSYILKYLYSKGPSFYASIDYFTEPPQAKIEIEKLICIFQCYNKTWPLILIWATCMGVLPYFQCYWGNDALLNILLGIFLFFTNIITSFFVILVILFFIRTKKLWELIKVELWNRENPAAKFIFSLSKRIAIIGAIYMTSSLTAWNTSQKITPFGYEVIIFTAFSILLLISSIVIPIYPFINNMINLKNEELYNIDVNIQKEYSVLMKKISTKEGTIINKKMNDLITMRKTIESIHTFPFQLKTIITSISIIFISLLPKIIEIALTAFFKSS